MGGGLGWTVGCLGRCGLLVRSGRGDAETLKRGATAGIRSVRAEYASTTGARCTPERNDMATLQKQKRISGKELLTIGRDRSDNIPLPSHNGT